MNIHRLKEAEGAFLARFPGGFDDPGLARIRKSHNVERLATFARSELTEVTFALPERFADTLLKIISRSSMVSRFEKPPFRELLSALSPAEKRHLSEAFRKRLNRGTQREGFEEIVDLFAHYKLARWSLVSAAPFYFAPSKEAFVKPSTAKRIVKFLDVEDLSYHPRPDWAFYTGYRKLILDIKKQVDSTLTPNNAAVTGFLMSSM
jgi:hypothetical protein